jgi:hypothetical protein
MDAGVRGCLLQNQNLPVQPTHTTFPQHREILFMYLSISDNAMSYGLVEDSDSVDKPVYFVGKVFKGDKLIYQKIE